MLPRSFYFLRHGETDWNKIGRLQGHTDIPLNDIGREQARSAIEVLQKLPIDRIVSSSLSRAYETAEIINQVLQKPIEKDERLREKYFGFFEGKTGSEIDQWKKENPDKIVIDPGTGLAIGPGAETNEVFHKRIFEAKKEYLEKYPDENILFVAHGAIYRVLCRAFFKQTDQSPNAKPFQFLRNAPMEWVLVSLD